MTTTLTLLTNSDEGPDAPKIPVPARPDLSADQPDLSVDRPDVSAEPPRLTLAPGGRSTGALDGAWWPRSRDLAVELPALTAAMDAPQGRITRALVNPTHWPVVPRKVQVAGRVLHVGWFMAEQDQHKVILRSYAEGRWDLLVIPPETSPAAAARLMRAASDPENLLTASALMKNEE